MSADLTADQINLSDSGFWGRPFEERDAAFRVLRDQRPVAFFDEPPWPFLPQGPGYWALTRFGDVVEASRNPAVFSSADGSVLPDLPAGGPPFSYLRSMIDMDNPGHADMRKIVARAFSPGAVRELASQVVTLAHEVVDTVIEDGECDLATQIATPLPVGLVCQLLGVPRSDWKWVRDRALIAYGRDDPEFVPGVLEEPELGALAVIQAVEEMAGYMKELSESKRSRPGDDLTSRLVRAEVAGRQLSEEELAQWFIPPERGRARAVVHLAGRRRGRDQQAGDHPRCPHARPPPGAAAGLAAGFRWPGRDGGGGDRALVRPGHRLSPHPEE